MSTQKSNFLVWAVSTALVLAALVVGFFLGKNSNPPINKDNVNTAERNVEPTDSVYITDTLTRVDTLWKTDTVRIEPENSPASKLVSASLENMNVMYIGVENKVNLSGNANLVNTQFRAFGSGARAKKINDTSYIVTVNKPGTVRLTLKGDHQDRLYEYEVKRIPDPVARLSKSSGGPIGNGEFKAQGGVGAFLDNFEYDVSCQIMGYSLTYLPKRGDAVESINAGARFNAKSKRMVNQAKPGDRFYFTNVKCKCPGDAAGRTINSMIFEIR